MKKSIFLGLLMAFVMLSCTDKNKGKATDETRPINDTSIVVDRDTSTIGKNSRMMHNTKKLYACPMHPEVQGAANDKCSKCGMKLTEPVPEPSKNE